MQKKVYRHWDLLLVPVDKQKNNPTKKSTTNCILEGEVTNHHHRADSNATVEIAVAEPTNETDYYRWYVTTNQTTNKDNTRGT